MDYFLKVGLKPVEEGDRVTMWSFSDDGSPGDSSGDSPGETLKVGVKPVEAVDRIAISSFSDRAPGGARGATTNEEGGQQETIYPEVVPHNQSIAVATSTQKKKKKSRKKKLVEGSASSEKRVSWGKVDEILFRRDISYDKVPSNGLYPLGLGVEEGVETWVLDEFSSTQQAALIARANEKGLFALTGSSSLSPLETRQFDYRTGKNPLFQSLTEEERVVLLTPYNLNDKSSDSHPISELNKDIKSIRMTRDNTGCSCKATKMDKLSVGKMKSELLTHGHHIGITTTEQIETFSKIELTAKTREMLKYCNLCVTDSCECVRLGVGCSAEGSNFLSASLFACVCVLCVHLCFGCSSDGSNYL